MKCLIVLALAFAAVSAGVVWPPTSLEECRKETGATERDVFDFKRNYPPLTEVTQCFYGCVYHKIKLLNDDWTFNPAVMEDYVHYIETSQTPKYTPELTQKMSDMMRHCVVEANKETPYHDKEQGYCIAAKEFGKCAIDFLDLTFP